MKNMGAGCHWIVFLIALLYIVCVFISFSDGDRKETAFGICVPRCRCVGLGAVGRRFHLSASGKIGGRHTAPSTGEPYTNLWFVLLLAACTHCIHLNRCAQEYVTWCQRMLSVSYQCSMDRFPCDGWSSKQSIQITQKQDNVQTKPLTD